MPIYFLARMGFSAQHPRVRVFSKVHPRPTHKESKPQKSDIFLGFRLNPDQAKIYLERTFVAVPVIAMPRALARGHPRDAKAPRVVRGGPIGHRVLRRGRVAARAVEEATSTSTSPSPASSSPTDCLPDADDALPDAVVEFLRRDGRHASFSSVKVGSIEVDEVNGGRSLREYMSLPASQYSTLDGEKVERVGDDTFVCTLGSFDFLGFKLQPVLTARVDVRPDG